MESLTVRTFRLKDAAVGSLEDGTLSEQQPLVRLGYDCVFDALYTVYQECNESTTLSKDKRIAKFLKNYKPAIMEYDKLKIKQTDFITKGIIGQGHFGEVRVVEEKHSKEIFAMKVMKKNNILQQADAAFFLEERDIMALNCSTWLTKLHYAFQDEHCLYLVMDYHPGGDLFTVMERKEGGMSEQDACFYLAEIVHDLHQLGYVHRDIKPDNVLITRSGHIKLVDFGSASKLDQDGKVIDCSLPVGTPEYISPEVLTSLDSKADYGVCCDWWSTGIILYELLFDVTPFEGSSTAQTYGNIMNHKNTLNFPEDISSDAHHLITHLLVDSNERLVYSDIVVHPFFANIDWDNIQSMMPPYIPIVKGPDDMSNFEKFEAVQDPLEGTGKSSRVFSGRNLPFVGFTYTVQCNTSSNDIVDRSFATTELEGMAQDIRKALEVSKTELKEINEKKLLLEKECVIYKNQLQELHNQLEVERKERRTSESNALKLLSEVREQSKIVQEIRESRNRDICSQVQGAVTQIEQEREIAIRRLQRAQDEIKNKKIEIDNMSGKLSDLRAKLSHVKETSRKELSNLQMKVTKVTEDSKKRIAELHNDYIQLLEKYNNTSKQLKENEDLNRKYKNELDSIKETHSTSTKHLIDKLEKEKRMMETHLMEKTTALELEKDKVNQLDSKLQELTLHIKELEECVDISNQNTKQIEMNMMKQNELIKKELNSICTDKQHLLKLYEELLQEKDSKDELLKKYKKENEYLTGVKFDLERKLNSTEHKHNTDSSNNVFDKQVKVLTEKIHELEEQLSFKNLENAKLKSQSTEIDSLNKQIDCLNEQLAQTTTSAKFNTDMLNETRKTKKLLETENHQLKVSLANEKENAIENVARAEALAKAMEDKYTKLLNDMDNWNDIHKQLKEMTIDKECLTASNEALRTVVEQLKSDREKLREENKRAIDELNDKKEQLETQELNLSLMKRNITIVEEQLNDALSISDEKISLQKQLQQEKEVILNDLNIAESKLDEINEKFKLEIETKKSLENQTSQLRTKLEDATSTHFIELQQLKEQLHTQQSLVEQHLTTLNEHVKNHIVQDTQFEEMKKELKLEQSLNAKLYNEISQLRQEHGKLQASHMKLSKQLQSKETCLEVVSREREQALQDKASIEEALDLERTKLHTQIAQFTKLIDYQHTPNVRKTRKGLRIGSRKKRDPIKERDEWNKLKSIAKLTNKDQQQLQSSDTESIEVMCTPYSTGRITRSSTGSSYKVSSTPLATSSQDIRRGQKRTADDNTGCILEHNIPHRFIIKSVPFHKTFTCVTCTQSIKHRQKFAKCTYCSMVCHEKCITDTPNTCGLPQELAQQLYNVTSPSKKSRSINTVSTSSITSNITDTNKENTITEGSSNVLLSKFNSLEQIKPLSINIVRCTTPSSHRSDSNESSAIDISITSSMLVDSLHSNNDSLV